MKTMNLYFDNASTSFPKPPSVARAVALYIDNCGGTYGRSFYPRACEATATVEQCRDELGRIMKVAAQKIFFAPGATWAINAILKGLNLTGRAVAVSGMEHNAVMRPLQYLSDTCGVSIVQLPSLADGTVDTRAVACMDLRDVALAVVNHQSNVNGVLQPIQDIMECVGTVPVMLDATQSLTAAGLHGFKDGDRRPDYIVFTGHKGLYGPTGTGGAYVANPELLAPFIHGGTGSRSESYLMPSDFPGCFEAGTPNMAGIFGLLAAIKHPPVPMHTPADFALLLDRLSGIAGMTLLRAMDPHAQGEIFSLVHSVIQPARIAEKLMTDYGCQTRPGLHCAPLAHRTLGLLPDGAVRVSLSAFHTAADMEYFAGAVEKICTR